MSDEMELQEVLDSFMEMHKQTLQALAALREDVDNLIFIVLKQR